MGTLLPSSGASSAEGACWKKAARLVRVRVRVRVRFRLRLRVRVT